MDMEYLIFTISRDVFSLHFMEMEYHQQNNTSTFYIYSNYNNANRLTKYFSFTTIDTDP